MTTFAMILPLLVLVFYGALYLCAFADYIIRSLGLYGIAKKRGVSLPGLAWLPVGNLWVLGSFVDSYEEKKEGHYKKWHVVLPALSCVVTILYVVFFTVYFLFYSILLGSISTGTEADFEFSGVPYLFLIAFIILMVLVMFFAIIMQALNYIALHKAYENICPQKALKYLIISLILPFGQGICMIRAKKLMPELTPFDDISANAPVNGYQFDQSTQNTVNHNDFV